MTARTIDGRALASRRRAAVAAAAAGLAETGMVPGLAAVLVGEDQASTTYVRMKSRACEEVGFSSRVVRRPAEIDQAELIALVDELNADPAVHGILVQLPLPEAIDPRSIMERIDPAKDVDGFHPMNVGRVVAGDLERAFVPATPAGIMALVAEAGEDPAGQEAVVIGRSDIVGKPVALLLLHAHATVTVCHSRTPDLASIARRGQILVAAVGRPRIVTPSMVRPGATVIDVGTNRVPRENGDGSRLVGDVDPAVAEVAGALTPVPGGVGPMTITMLLENTLLAAQRSAAGP